MSKHLSPSRGEVWYVDLDPTVGHEQAKRRPCLVISNNAFNQDDSGLFVIVPLTSKTKNNPFHIPVKTSESGLRKPSFILCDQIRTVSEDRFDGACLGLVNQNILNRVEYALKILLELY